MVKITPVDMLRPRLTDEFKLGEFVPRTDAITEAYEWGKQLHTGHKRFSGEPYFETHCVWIANFLDNLIGNETWTIAALLHDSVEDRGGSLEQIKTKFPGSLGEDVAYIVDGVTKLSTSRDGRSRQIETLRKIAMFRDPGVFLVKLADKTHNVMTLEHMTLPKRRQKAAEAIRAYGRLAGIFNCYKWRRWLEDMAFPHAYPEIYAMVKGKIDSDPRLQLDFINRNLEQLGAIMEKAGIEGSVEVIVNGYWQTWQKLKRMARMRKTSLTSFSALNDLVSFRMIVDGDDAKACYNLLADVNRFLGPYLDQDRFDDYIACPQQSYRALQVTAWIRDYGAIEVAIATKEMENENQWGVVYALNKGKNIDGYRTIEILTPSGGVRFLPEGSTVLDGVAAIQQGLLLDKIAAVHVNNNLARLSDKVKPGDLIEVITGGQRMVPSEEWLNFCNRSTARLLRIVLATEALRKSAVEGRKVIKNALTERGILSLEDVDALEGDKIKYLLGQMGSSSLEDLYSAVGGGAIPLDEVTFTLDEIGISKQALSWTSMRVTGDSEANRPGILARVAGIVSEEGGNILRVVNDTIEDGGFAITVVIAGLDAEQEVRLRATYENSKIEFSSIEMV
jgi:(p)ppGpp synthase/HD superfamily hydrolase